MTKACSWLCLVNGVAGFVNNYLAGMTGTVGTNFVRIAVKNERLAGEETEDGGLRCDINFTQTCSAPLKFSTESFLSYYFCLYFSIKK